MEQQSHRRRGRAIGNLLAFLTASRILMSKLGVQHGLRPREAAILPSILMSVVDRIASFPPFCTSYAWHLWLAALNWISTRFRVTGVPLRLSRFRLWELGKRHRLLGGVPRLTSGLY